MRKRILIIGLVVLMLAGATTVLAQGQGGGGGPIFEAIEELRTRVTALEDASIDNLLCGAGQVVKSRWSSDPDEWVGWECAKDDDTIYAAGNQLELDDSNNQFSVLEGSGSGLDADTLDGKESSSFTYTAGNQLGLDANNQFSVLEGPGSGLDADTLDGRDSSSFTYTAGNQLGLDANNQFSVLEGPGSGLDADTLDGMDSERFLYTDDEGNVAISGDVQVGEPQTGPEPSPQPQVTMFGNVQVGEPYIPEEWQPELMVYGSLDVWRTAKVRSVEYQHPRTHYLSIDQTAFQPTEDRQYQLASEEYGAMSELMAALVAPATFPDGAVVKGFTCYFYDAYDGTELACNLKYRSLDNGQSNNIIGTHSDTSAGHVARSFTGGGLAAVIDNEEEAYYVIVHPETPAPDRAWTSWPGVAPEDGMGIKGVVVRYEVSEAP